MVLKSPSLAKKQRQLNEQEFFLLLRNKWEPGQHIGIAAPTGWGKTWLLARIMAMREWSVVFAIKQEDSSIERFEGFQVLDTWRDRWFAQKHLVVWPDTRNLNPDDSEFRKLKEGRYLLDSVFREKHWTLGIDDLNDACAIGLKHKLSAMLRLCRSQKTSLVVNYQRPFNIIQEALSQVQWTLASYHKDQRDVIRLAEANGLAPRDAILLNHQLKRFDCVLYRPMEEPIIIRRSGTP